MNMSTKYRRYELKLHGIANYGYSFNKKKMFICHRPFPFETFVLLIFLSIVMLRNV